MDKRIHNLTYTLAMIPVSACVIDGNIRVAVDDDEIDRLGDSLDKRQIHPIICLDNGDGTYQVLDGGKRVRAAGRKGRDQLLAAVSKERMTPEAIRELQLVSAFHRSDPNSIDQAEAMAAVKATYPDWTNEKLADHFNISAKMVRVLLSPGLVVEAAREAFKGGRIGISDCHTLSLHDDPAQQLALLGQRLAGASRDAIAQASRKQRGGNGNGTVPAAKSGRIRIPLPSGVTVTLAGDGLTIEDAIHELADAMGRLKKAEKEGLDVKTFQAVCRDKAKAAV